MNRVRADADVFRAIADPTRRAILDRLRAGPIAVNELAGTFDQSRPAISRHLRVLRLAKMVTEEKIGRARYYQIHPASLRDVVDWLDGYRVFWQSTLDSLKSYLEAEK